MAIRDNFRKAFSRSDERMKDLLPREWTWGEKLMIAAYTIEVMQNGTDAEFAEMSHLLREVGSSTAMQDELLILAQHLSKEPSGELLDRVKKLDNAT